jgi:branched-chain amino acid transport system permease protein
MEETLSTILQLVVSGVAMGCIYILIGISFVLVYNAVDVINFAHAELVMLSGFVGVTLASILGLPIIVSIVATVIVMGLVGVLFERVAYYPLRHRPPLYVIISTIAISLALKDAVRLIWGAQPLRFPPFFETYSIGLLGANVNPQLLLIVGVTVLLLAIQYLVFERSTLGKQMMATAQDRQTANLLGINTGLMITATFVYSLVLAAVAGILLVPIFFAHATMATLPAMKAFTAAVIGGFGSIPGIVAGGLLIGLLESLGGYFISSAYKDAIAFVILIAFLLVKPEGFFGERISERA